ncbi:MAG: rod shape-determining protein MreD [Chlamydiales bacterium]|nr:rod shape-determining protein MreD [Chlamydiales bacterium]
MTMRQYVTYSFFISLSICLFSSVFLPFFHLNYFAPLLCTLAKLLPLHQSIWIAFFCGLMLDSLNFTLSFGIYALSYVLCMIFIYRIKHFFFDDKTFSFALLVSVFSLLFSILEMMFCSINHKSYSFSFFSLISQVLIMPIINGIYGFLWVIFPAEIKKRSKQLQTLLQDYKIKKNKESLHG